MTVNIARNTAAKIFISLPSRRELSLIYAPHVEVQIPERGIDGHIGETGKEPAECKVRKPHSALVLTTC